VANFAQVTIFALNAVKSKPPQRLGVTAVACKVLMKRHLPYHVFYLEIVLGSTVRLLIAFLAKIFVGLRPRFVAHVPGGDRIGTNIAGDEVVIPIVVLSQLIS